MTGSYDRDVVVLQVIVLLWQTGWMIRSLRALARGDRRTILFVQLVYYFFFAMPQLLDLVVGAPSYLYQHGFIVSQFDHTTNIVYLLYLAVVPVIFEGLGGRPAAVAHEWTVSIRLGTWTRAFAWTAMLALPFTLVLAPHPTAYLHYAAFINRTVAGAENYHVIVTLVASLAAIGAVLVIAAEGSLAIARVAAMPFLSVAVWVHGKRSLVALVLLLVLYLLWMRGLLRGRRFVIAALTGAIVLGAFSYAYQTGVRDVGKDAPVRGQTLASSDAYLNYRIDYGRDAVTKQTIYAELHPEEFHILDYRGQSILFDLTIPVPRAVWPGKPYPYAVYVTSAMFGIAPRDLGWSVTTSWLEEAIANFGWLGIVLGPAVPALICAAGDRRRGMLTGILTVSVASFLLVVPLVAFFSMFALWVVMMIRGRRDARTTPTASSGLRSRRWSR